jgi:hypothetical protein
MKLALGLALLLAIPARAEDPVSEAARAYAIDTACSTTSIRVGEKGKLVVVIRPRTPIWHVHPQAPLKVRFEASPTVKLERAELGRRDALDPKAEEPRFETTFVAAAAGAVAATANVDFFICSDAACVRQGRAVPIPIAVEGAGSRPAP